MIDLDRQRAKAALSAVRKLETRAEEQGGDSSNDNAANAYGNYVSFVKALPATVLQNGLGQALASELAASSQNGNATQKGHYELFHHVCNWLGRSHELAPYPNACDENTGTDTNRNTGILKPLIEGDESAYLRAQYETLAYLDWLKKFAVALLIQPEGDK